MDIESAKHAYLENEIWILTFGGAFQHASIYNATAIGASKRKFRDAIKRRVRERVRSKYAQGDVSSAEHTQQIAELAAWASDHYGRLLANGRLRLGVAQKLLNLYLKYLWCWGGFPEPPHCPFDRTIIRKLRCGHQINWTDMDDIEEYRMLVRAAEEASGGQIPVAQWELREFNRQ